MKRKFTKYPIKAGRYSDVVPYNQRKYWYFTTHGTGPGTLPKDVILLESRDGQNEKGTWGTFICVDSVLNTDELRKYDLRELAPKDVKSACGKKQVKSSADEFGPFSRSDEDTVHDAEIRHKLIYEAGLDPDVVSRVSTRKAQELYDYYCEGEGKCMRGPYPSEYGDFDETVMESTDIFASYRDWDGYFYPEWILQISNKVSNMKEAKKLADYINQSEYTSGFATPTRFLDYFNLDELYEEMLEEIGG